MPISKVAVIFDNKVRPDTTGIYCRRALGQLVEVEHFLPSELSRVPRGAFDLYLNIDDGLEYRLPSDLRPCAWWAIDTHLNPEWCQARAADFDFVFAAQRDGAELLRRAGIATACWLPLACDPELHRKHDVPKEFDVCFVGHVFGGPRPEVRQRGELVQRIQQRFRNTFVGQRFFEDMARTYSASRTVFNRSILNDINMRVFEALACGSLLVTNDLRDNGQEELFQDGKHLATYRDAEELLDKIAFYLAREELRERIAAAGRAEVLGKDTYRHRMEKVLATVEQGLARKTVPVTGAPGEAPNTKPEGLLDLIPKTARRVLVVGCEAETLGDALRQRPAVEVTTLEMGPHVEPARRGQAEQALCGDAKQPDSLFGPASFDAIVCAGALERLHEPLAGLRRCRAWLGPEGRLVARVANVRHHTVVRSLLEGNWSYEPGGILEEASVRFFTRRDLEKLLYRAGYEPEVLSPVHGPGDAEHLAAARRGEVKIGNLQIGGLPPNDAEDFLTQQYLLRVKPLPAADHGLTSIVILTHNQLDYTRQCVDSIRRHTDEPYELIFIDNASTDGTVEYLSALPDVRLIRNERNRGFPAAANQGIQAAGGQQVLLLNNDCVVCTGWLGRLLAALYREPDIGLAGPCSNFVSGEQQVEVSYTDLTRLDAFAWDWAKAHHRQVENTDRLVGFCLLIRRAVIDQIGPLDERFGIGCFEDDDFCWRALAAGFRAVIARDAFVHHYGGRTFRASGIDFGALMHQNQALFEEKWRQSSGHGPTAPASLPPEPATGLHTGYALREAEGGGLLLEPQGVELSLCMIVRDNEKTLGQTLQSIKPDVDEMIVVDTGSKDRTAEIARELGARVYSFAWPDSFAVARNESLKYARGRWIFWMDSDDTIDPDNGRKLRALIRQPLDPTVMGFFMQVHCPGAGEDGEHQVTVVHHVKLFRNHPGIRFERRIHEQVLLPIRRLGGTLVETDVFVVHSGYDHSPEGQQCKKERDLFLLGLELKDDPNDPFTLFNLGMTYNDVGEYAEAIRYLERCRQVSTPEQSHLRKAYALLVCAYTAAHEAEEAWQACLRGLELYPEDVELRFRKALLLHDRGQLADSAQQYEELLASGPVEFPGSVVQGLQGFMARQNLAAVYADLGDLARAEEQWRRITAEVPRYRPGWHGLGAVLLRQGKQAEASRLAETLCSDRQLRRVGLVLQADLDERAGDMAGARRHLRQAVQEFPSDIDARHALCRFLFERGPENEAEQALRELLRLAPKDASALHNLGTVCCQQGRYREAVTAYRESLKHRPKAPATARQLAAALQQDGRREEAVAAWEEALRLAPDDASTVQALAEARRLGQAGPVAAGRQSTPTRPAKAARHVLPLRDRSIEVSMTTRGPVDEAIVHDVWERDIYGVRRLDRPPDVVVDIGAHIGTFAVLAAESWPGARVIACEPDPDNFGLLEQNLRGRSRIELVQAAVLGDDRPEVEFHRVADKVSGNSGGGSCAAPSPAACPRGCRRYRPRGCGSRRAWRAATYSSWIARGLRSRCCGRWLAKVSLGACGRSSGNGTQATAGRRPWPESRRS
jgi:GT2 family glycosyltransferase/tetratricopeptide (TPR) repeat protein/SAM-dependent methyltransferase